VGSALIQTAVDELLLRGFHYLPAQVTWRLHDRALSRIRAHGKQLAPRAVRCRGGFRLLVDPADWIGSHIALRREFEPGLTRLVQRFLRPGGHFVDVGANIGYFSLLAACVVGNAGQVSSFEASPIITHTLMRNIFLNGMAHRVSVHEAAVWHADAELTFHQGPLENAGLSNLGDNSRATASFKVHATTLDSALEHTERPVNFVKLDVEGAEYNALLGMNQVITRFRPIIALELSPAFLRRFGCISADVLDLLTKEHRYVVYCYDAKGRLCEADIRGLCVEAEQQNNLVFSPSEKRLE
jgi:FkbM family methyltransferase